MKVTRAKTAVASKPKATAKPKRPSASPQKSIGNSPRSSFTAAATTTSSSTSASHSIVDNQAYLPALMKLLDGATKSINIAQYNMYSESGDAKAITDKLIALKQSKPNLKIRVFLEGDHGSGAVRNQATAAKLKAAGIDVVFDSKNLITHEKVVSVDGKHVLAGSHNMSNTSMDKNNEVSLALNSPTLAKAYDKYFDQLETDPSHLHPSTVKSGHVTMITDTAYEGQLLDVIKSAKHTLDASMYDFNFVSGDPRAQEIMAALKDAITRGVKVNLWLEQSNDQALEGGITKNNEAAMKALTDAGATVHLDDPSQISHQKFIIRDSAEVLMGSTNWTANDFDQRHQVNWRIADSKLAVQLKGILQNEIDTESKAPVTF